MRRPYVYIAARLFSPIDRLAALALSDLTVQKISDEFRISKKKASNCVFLPFRDTDQSRISGCDRSRKIFELDIDELKKATHILARLDGITKDSGVVFEMGYAHALGKFCGALMTDFVWDGSSYGNFSQDPILQNSGINLYRYYNMESTSSYKKANYNLENRALNSFLDKVHWDHNSSTEYLTKDNNHVFIDCFGGRYEWCLDYYSKFDNFNNVRVAKRWINPDPTYVTKESDNDIIAAISSGTTVFVADGLEMDCGSAFLMGLCYGLNKRIILQYSSCIRILGDGGQDMRLNLMLEQAADTITNSIDETIQVIQYVN